MKISFIRGAYLNNFEGQNYDLPITGYSSLYPLDQNIPFPLVKLPSIADLQTISLLSSPVKYFSNRILGDSQILFGLEKYIVNSDIVHVGDPHYYYSYQAAQLKDTGRIKKLVSTWWETIPFNNESTYAKKFIKRYTMNQVDMFICYTQRARECLIQEGVAKDRTTVIPLGVNLAQFHPFERKKSNRFVILFVGRLVEEKGILDLYQAFKLIASKEKNVQLRIVGEGPLEKKLRYEIQKDGLTDRVAIDYVCYKDIPLVFQNADVLCVPSKKTKTWEEQYGMVFIEAMASGIPIVSYDSGSIKDIVGNAGIIIPEGEMQILGDSLTLLIKSGALGKKIGTIGRVRAEKMYDSRKTAKILFKVYQLVNEQ